MYGTPVPVAGKMAALTMATEFAKLWSGDDDCALPQRITSVSRQGVSYTILDNQEFIAELRTGLYAVDLFLKQSTRTTLVENQRYLHLTFLVLVATQLSRFI